MRLDVEAARCDHSADRFEELIAVFGEVTASSADGTINSWIDLVVAAEITRFGCLLVEKKFKSKFTS